MCGYDLGSPGWEGGPPWAGGSPTYDICPSCGLEFGNEDQEASNGPAEAARVYRRLREAWVRDGMRFWYAEVSRLRANQPPPGWDPVAQLRRVDPNLAASLNPR